MTGARHAAAISRIVRRPRASAGLRVISAHRRHALHPAQVEDDPQPIASAGERVPLDHVDPVLVDAEIRRRPSRTRPSSRRTVGAAVASIITGSTATPVAAVKRAGSRFCHTGPGRAAPLASSKNPGRGHRDAPVHA